MAREESKRIQEFRSRELRPNEAKLIDDIEKYDCHIIQVRSENEIPGWSYTIGLFEVFGRPEVIVVGLEEEMAHFVLNEVADRYRRGTTLGEGDRLSDLLGNVDCEFRFVETRWVRQGLMGYAEWFYRDDEFPALQCIYPDLDGKFPWEDGFDASWRGMQALLFRDAPQSGVEQDLWASHDPSSSLYSWKFPVPPHTGVYTTEPVNSGQEPVLLVTHDAGDGAWQFIGTTDGSSENGAIVCFHHMVDRDPTIKELTDLPEGWIARRDAPSEPWTREIRPPDDLEIE
jgi:Domain of unknown function (DUF4262)